MKSERRHELQHNDLLVWVNSVVERIKPYGTLIMLLVVLAVVAFAGWRWWSRQAQADTAYAWDELFGAMNSGDPAVVSDVAEQQPNSEVGQWAGLVAADMYLSNGSRQLFDSKATAAQDLRKSVDGYLSVLQVSRSSTIRERATFGLAKAYESLAGTRQSEGELEKAVQYYQEVASTWPDGAFAGIANQRIEDLQRKETREFYDKFAQYDPQPAYTDEAPPGGAEPTLDLRSLDEGTVPDHTEAIKPGAAPSAEDEAAGAMPASETAAEPAAEAKPQPEAEEAPAETPAGEPAEKPAEAPAVE